MALTAPDLKAFREALDTLGRLGGQFEHRNAARIESILQETLRMGGMPMNGDMLNDEVAKAMFREWQTKPSPYTRMVPIRDMKAVSENASTDADRNAACLRGLRGALATTLDATSRQAILDTIARLVATDAVERTCAWILANTFKADASWDGNWRRYLPEEGDGSPTYRLTGDVRYALTQSAIKAFREDDAVRREMPDRYGRLFEIPAKKAAKMSDNDVRYGHVRPTLKAAWQAIKPWLDVLAPWEGISVVGAEVVDAEGLTFVMHLDVLGRRVTIGTQKPPAGAKDFEFLPAMVDGRVIDSVGELRTWIAKRADRLEGTPAHLAWDVLTEAHPGFQFCVMEPRRLLCMPVNQRKYASGNLGNVLLDVMPFGIDLSYGIHGSYSLHGQDGFMWGPDREFMIATKRLAGTAP